MSPTLPRAFPPLARGWVPTTCHGLTSLGGSWAQSQLAGVRGRGQQGWWKRRGTGTALGGSGVAVDLAVCGWGAHGAPAVWGRDRRSRRRQRSEEKKTDLAASPGLAPSALASPPRGFGPGHGLGVSWQDAGRARRSVRAGRSLTTRGPRGEGPQGPWGSCCCSCFWELLSPASSLGSALSRGPGGLPALTSSQRGVGRGLHASRARGILFSSNCSSPS